MAIKISGTTVIDDNKNVTTINSYGFSPQTTNTRPTNPTSGTIIYNSDVDSLEVYSSTAGWTSISSNTISSNPAILQTYFFGS